MSDATLTALVKELRPDRTTGEVIDEIQNRWGRRLSPRERRTVIEYCSRFANWGHTQHVAALPSPTTLGLADDIKKIYQLHASERRGRLTELLTCVLEKVAGEDLIDVLCPPIGSI